VKCCLILPHERWWGPTFSAESLTEVCRAAEAAGFDACAATDHPFPNVAEIRGAHHAFDVLTLLTYVASVTTTIKLHTHVLVAPFHNPYLTANAVATLSELVGDRILLGVGPGYLPSEFVAMGADFERRGTVTEAWITAFDAAWRNQASFSGLPFFPAQGNTLRSEQVRASRPPIWVGGNSLAAVERAVRVGDGWCPFRDTSRSPGLGTAHIETLCALERRITVLRDRLDAAGRSGPFDVCLSDPGPWAAGHPEDVLQHLDELSVAGVTWTAFHLEGGEGDVAGFVERIHAFGSVLRTSSGMAG
jgi:probable F420-dependent oxidoreductase